VIYWVRSHATRLIVVLVRAQVFRTTPTLIASTSSITKYSANKLVISCTIVLDTVDLDMFFSSCSPLGYAFATFDPLLISWRHGISSYAPRCIALRVAHVHTILTHLYDIFCLWDAFPKPAFLTLRAAACWFPQPVQVDFNAWHMHRNASATA
jgi:hypothetical protein